MSSNLSFETEYTVTTEDFRKASYYGLFLRHRKPLLIMFLAVSGAGIYCLAGALGLGEINIFVPLLAAAYFVWGLLLFAGAEKGIRNYFRREDNLIGCRYRASFEKYRVVFDVEERNIHAVCPFSKLACAYEMSSLFMIYVTTQEVYLVPVRALSPEQRLSLRSSLRSVLKDRFGSRFG